MHRSHASMRPRHAPEVEAGFEDTGARVATSPRRAFGKDRLHLTLPTGSIQRLEWLKDHVAVDSTVDVVRDALSVYEAIVKALVDGQEFYVRHPEQDVVVPINLRIDLRPEPEKAKSTASERSRKASSEHQESAPDRSSGVARESKRVMTAA